MFEAICAHKNQLIAIVRLNASLFPSLPCFSSGAGSASLGLDDAQKAVRLLEERLSPSQSSGEHVKMLIQQSIGSWRTHWYDTFQFYSTGIF